MGFGCFLFWLIGTFPLLIEHWFFEEFRSHFNTVVVGCPFYPTEAFVNIWDSSPVPAVPLLCAILGTVWLLAAFKPICPTVTGPVPPRLRRGPGALGSDRAISRAVLGLTSSEE